MGATALRHRSGALELLDGPLVYDVDLAGNLRDLARINRWTGADRLVHAAVRRLLPPTMSSFRYLDVGGGRGDGVVGTTIWAVRHGLGCEGIVLDRSGPIVQLSTVHRPPIQAVLRADGRCLPFADQSIDIAACSLVLHHFAEQPALQLLREMRRVARLGVVVDDLLRSHVGHLGASVMARWLTKNRLTRHDGPLSVRRAFRAQELTTLLERAGLRPVHRWTIPGYRAVVAATKIQSGMP